MKILLVDRSDLLQKFGGDSIKTLKTKEYLEKNGAQVDLILGKKDISLSHYDLIHIFNLQNIKLVPWWIKRATLANKPIVISTGWWRSQNTTTYLYKIYKKYHVHYSSPLNISEHVIGKKISLTLFNNVHKLKFFYKERYAVKNTDWLITESNSEIKHMAIYFNMPELGKKSISIPNGLHEEIIKEQNFKTNLLNSLPKDFILTVGRIDPVKNQVSLIKALFNNKEIPLVFVGSKKGPLSFKKYISEFEQFSKKRGNVYWFDEMPLKNLPFFYQRAHVYCQPSIWETFGIAIFEAGYFGCNLVVSEESGAKDYLKKRALFCSPLNLDSIKGSIMSAFKKPKNNNLSNYIKKNFEWGKIALQLFKIYHNVLNGYRK
ncbi:glycosyltransferase family 4 protein [Patescibacteria group bacterium AH-259-L05]|nr:glycosyltransferase family 4 protein [Patescibacteria group bacterium AH-259-L05]